MQPINMVHMTQYLGIIVLFSSYWQRHMYMLMPVYHHVYQSLNCQYYQYLTSISYHVNTKSQQFCCTSNCRKTVTSHCSNIQLIAAKHSLAAATNKPAAATSLIAAKTSLAAASTLCLSQTEHETHNSTCCSQFEFSRCGENPTRCCKYCQR